MVTVFWDAQGIWFLKFKTRGTTTENSKVYCLTLKKFKRGIHNKHYGLLNSGVVLLQGIARPHTPVRTQEVLHKFKRNVFQHPPYSPYMAHSDYHLFSSMKQSFNESISLTLRSLKTQLHIGLNRRRLLFKQK
ncbi:histone-lysine N-methyltransferase SETMAR [Trichonephila clavipes]|nr:histone-lysine N-methyltransferase SETMAR [Trichonephila clavipes]